MTAPRSGVYALIEAALPERPACAIGVLLLDPETDRGWLKMREQHNDIATPDDAEVLAALEHDFRSRIAEMGANAFLQSLEDSLSNVLRITDRQSIAVDSFTRVLSRLYSDHVEPVAVYQFDTHVPLYTLRAAAGHLGEEMPVDAEDWIPAPEGIKLTPGMFAAHVVGRSMEPRIPDGSVNLFRYNPVGSRQGKIVLVERYGIADEIARYTVKRYTSEKRALGGQMDGQMDGQWEHTRIRLEPLNPEFDAWDVEPEGFAVIAEWLRVIE
jgi:phage repressor protein C with HTH and peptisase S24 domain